MSAGEEILARWEQTVHEIKTRMRSLVDALNTRTFTMDNTLVCEVYDPNVQIARSPYFPSKGVTSLEDYASQVQEMNKAFPNWSLQNADLKDVIYVDETNTHCISSIEVHNVPDGIIRQVMTLFKFHLKDGKWMIHTTEAVAGFEPDENPDAVSFQSSPS